MNDIINKFQLTILTRELMIDWLEDGSKTETQQDSNNSNSYMTAVMKIEEQHQELPYLLTAPLRFLLLRNNCRRWRTISINYCTSLLII